MGDYWSPRNRFSGMPENVGTTWCRSDGWVMSEWWVIVVVLSWSIKMQNRRKKRISEIMEKNIKKIITYNNIKKHQKMMSNWWKLKNKGKGGEGEKGDREDYGTVAPTDGVGDHEQLWSAMNELCQVKTHICCRLVQDVIKGWLRTTSDLRAVRHGILSGCKETLVPFVFLLIIVMICFISTGAWEYRHTSNQFKSNLSFPHWKRPGIRSCMTCQWCIQLLQSPIDHDSRYDLFLEPSRSAGPPRWARTLAWDDPLKLPSKGCETKNHGFAGA